MMPTVKELKKAHDEYIHCGGTLDFVNWVMNIGVKPEEMEKDKDAED